MSAGLGAWVEGVGLIGPGLANWEQGRAILGGHASYVPQKTQLPMPQWLPPAERRRSCNIVKATLAIGEQALAAAHIEARDVPAVFASSGGEGENCHALCEILASNDRRVSPTRFHNSVHNLTAGYWGIATGAMSNATVVCAYDGSFSAGLLEALTQCVADGRRVLFMAYDTSYPEPLNGARPIADTLGIALVLSAERKDQALAHIRASLSREQPMRLADTALETLRASIPAARGLPLLQALTRGAASQGVLEYLGDTSLAVEVTPC
jgi:hypothetical protein